MSSRARRAGVIGTGLIGGSIGMALRERGWHVTGRDVDEERAHRSLELGAVDAVGTDAEAEITFVATPVGRVVDAVREALTATRGLVTDVGSVKAPLVRAIDDPRFVGGHPMAGSELTGVDGADPELFQGAVWVLTPADTTADSTYLEVRSIVTALGAEVLDVPPERHDALVAVVSHVPHLTAATLMGVADERAEDHRALLRLAAGGFRDMTRVASGHPGIWPDICAENGAAIVDVLDQLVERLREVRALVEGHDRDGLLGLLERARVARRNLPTGIEHPDEVAVVRVPIPDRPGMLAEITTLATELGVNIHDIEIAHSSEGERGVAILLLGADAAPVLQERLADHGFRASTHPLE